MKLLLTSGGLTNELISNALFDLTNKSPQETTVVFIPTASNAEAGDKTWLIDDLLSLKKYNFKSIEITDISAVTKEILETSFKNADVLFFEGGNSYHLMNWLTKTGLDKSLPKLLQNKVYVGVSAGSIVTNPKLSLEILRNIYDNTTIDKSIKALNLVNFYFFPHLNSKWFKKVRRSNIEEIAETINKPIYALDDQSALKIIDNKVEVISNGSWFCINKDR